MAVNKAQCSAEVGGLVINDTVVVATQGSNIPSYDITWTQNEPTAGSTATIADGDAPTVAESGQAIADLTAKLNAVIAALETHGLLADS